MTQPTHEKIVRIGALYDIFAMAPFALPMVSVWAYSLIQWVDSRLGFHSHFAALDATSMFLLNIGACAYLLWGLLRLRTASREYARFSGSLRIVVVVLQVIAVSGGATPFLLVLGALQLLLAAFELYQGLSERKTAKPIQQGARSY